MSAPSSLSNIRIILVEPSHPGNIGSAARAVKVMGLEQLYLVNPEEFPHKKATILASQAADILDRAVVVNTFSEAIQDCSLVLGASSRIRALPWPTLTARAAAPMAIQEAESNTVAIVFGRENSGLNNEELQRCHYQVDIPSNPNYGSLNLAAAVQVICYEIRMAWLEQNLNQTNTQQLIDLEELSTTDEIEKFYVHLEQVLYEIGFLERNIPNQVINRLRRLFNRTRLEKSEVNILRGILTTLQKKL